MNNIDSVYINNFTGQSGPENRQPGPVVGQSGPENRQPGQVIGQAESELLRTTARFGSGVIVNVNVNVNVNVSVDGQGPALDASNGNPNGEHSFRVRNHQDYEPQQELNNSHLNLISNAVETGHNEVVGGPGPHPTPNRCWAWCLRCVNWCLGRPSP